MTYWKLVNKTHTSQFHHAVGSLMKTFDGALKVLSPSLLLRQYELALYVVKTSSNLCDRIQYAHRYKPSKTIKELT